MLNLHRIDNYAGPNQCFGSGCAWIRIDLVSWIRFRLDSGEKNGPKNKKKIMEKFMFEVLDVFFWG
jgi:hypothetical protein